MLSSEHYFSIMLCLYADCQYGDNHYADCHYIEFIMPTFTVLSVIVLSLAKYPPDTYHNDIRQDDTALC
jgi:hypothetical protein